MHKCATCKVKSWVIFPCDYCNKKYCTSHIQNEKHDCPGLKTKREDKKNALENKLESARSPLRQVIDI